MPACARRESWSGKEYDKVRHGDGEGRKSSERKERAVGQAEARLRTGKAVLPSHTFTLIENRCGRRAAHKCDKTDRGALAFQLNMELNSGWITQVMWPNHCLTSSLDSHSVYFSTQLFSQESKIRNIQSIELKRTIASRTEITIIYPGANL